MSVMSRSWLELGHFFEVHTDSEPYNYALKSLSKLCKWIADNDFSLHGFTSHHSLCITQTEPTYPLHYSIQRLIIEPNIEGRVEFKFIQNELRKAHYVREVSPNDVVLQMCKFLKQTGWVETIPFPT